MALAAWRQRAAFGEDLHVLECACEGRAAAFDVGRARRFVAQSWSFERVRAMGRAYDGTLNDAVMAMCAGALRKHLQEQRDLPKISLKAMAPVSLRAAGDVDSANAIGMVIADLATISGSIGVFAMLPTGEGLMSKIGVNTGGYQTSWLAGAYDPRKALDPRMQLLVQSSIEHIYADFIGKVSQTRKLELAKVDDLAQGRIWTGAQAVEHKLIDRLGSFSDAVQEARARVAELEGAKSSDKELPIKYVGPKTSPFERFAQKFFGQCRSLKFFPPQNKLL